MIVFGGGCFLFVWCFFCFILLFVLLLLLSSCGVLFKDSCEFAVTQHHQLFIVTGNELVDRRSQPSTFYWCWLVKIVDTSLVNPRNIPRDTSLLGPMPPSAQKTTSRATSNASVAFLGGKDGSIQKQTPFHPVIGSLFCLLLQIFKNKENKTLQIHEALIVCIKHQTSNHSNIKYQKRKKKKKGELQV